MLKLTLNYLKSLLASCVIFTTAISVCCAICLVKDVSDTVTGYVCFIPLVLCSFSSGFVCAKLNNRNGLVHGLISQLPFMLLLSCVTFLFSKSLNVYFLVPLLICTVFGATGGIVAVNTKKK